MFLGVEQKKEETNNGKKEFLLKKLMCLTRFFLMELPKGTGKWKESESEMTLLFNRHFVAEAKEASTKWTTAIH